MSGHNGEGNGHGCLSWDELERLEDRRVEEVAVAAWGGRVVRLRALGAYERDMLERLNAKAVERGEAQVDNFTAHVLAFALVGPDGRPLACDATGAPQPAKVKALGRKSSAALLPLLRKTLELSGLSRPDDGRVRRAALAVLSAAGVPDAARLADEIDAGAREPEESGVVEEAAKNSGGGPSAASSCG